MAIASGVLERFIQMNPRIKSFTMDTISGTDILDKVNSSIFRIIGTCLTELEELKIIHCYVGTEEPIGNRKENLVYLARLRHLKKLYFDFNLYLNKELLDALAAAAVPIETLHLLRFTLVPKTFKSLSKLIQVKELHFDDARMKIDQLTELMEKLPHLNKLNISNSGEFSVKDIVKMIEAAQNLEHFKLRHQKSLVINKKQFYTVLKAVKKRNNGIKLVVIIFGDDCDIDVPESVIEQNNAWLEIEVNDDFEDEEYSEEDELNFGEACRYSQYDEIFYEDDDLNEEEHE